LEDKLYDISTEVRKIEKEAVKSRSNYALKRANATQRLTQAQDVLSQVTQRKELALMSFQGLQEQIRTETHPKEVLELPLQAELIPPKKLRKRKEKRVISAK
jgi:hypothetical protein